MAHGEAPAKELVIEIHTTELVSKQKSDICIEMGIGKNQCLLCQSGIELGKHYLYLSSSSKNWGANVC